MNTHLPRGAWGTARFVSFAALGLLFLAAIVFVEEAAGTPTFSQVYEATFNGVKSGHDQIAGIAVDGAGNAYVTGYSVTGCHVVAGGCGGDIFSMTTLRYNAGATGNPAPADMQQLYSSSATESFGQAVAVGPDGNVYVAGYAPYAFDPYNGPAIYSIDPVVMKYNSSLKADQWVNAEKFRPVSSRWCTSHDVRPKALSFDSQGRIYVATTFSGCPSSSGTAPNPGAYPRFKVFRFNALGQLEYFGQHSSSTYYSGALGDVNEATGIAVAPDGSFYVSGYIRSSFTGMGPLREDWRVVKFNADGTLNAAWNNNPATRFDSGELDRAEGVVIGADGNVYVAGTIGISSGNAAVRVVKYSAETGEIIAEAAEQSPNSYAYAEGIAVNPSGEIYVATSNIPQGSSTGGFKYSPSLVRLWSSAQWGFRLNSLRAFGIAVDAGNNFYIAGYGESPDWRSGTSGDYKTFKVSESGAPPPPPPPPALSVSLSAYPTSGDIPLTSVLTAVVSGTQTSLRGGEFGFAKRALAQTPIQYSFNCDNGTTNSFASNDSEVSYSCTYTSAGEYDASVIVTDARGRTTAASVRISVFDPNVPPPVISVSLSARPNSGQRPLNDVDLVAVVSSAPAGELSYEFDCGTTPPQTASVATAERSYTALDACDFADPGTYAASVTVRSGSDEATDTATITVFGRSEDPPF